MSHRSQPAISYCQAVCIDRTQHIGILYKGQVRAVLEGPPNYVPHLRQFTLCVLDSKKRLKTVTRFPLNTRDVQVAKKLARTVLPILLVGQKKPIF